MPSEKNESGMMPCPWCGSAARVEGPNDSVTCSGVLCCGRQIHTSAAAWNRRAHGSAPMYPREAGLRAVMALYAGRASPSVARVVEALRVLANDHEFGAPGTFRQEHLKQARAALRAFENSPEAPRNDSEAPKGSQPIERDTFSLEASPDVVARVQQAEQNVRDGKTVPWEQLRHEMGRPPEPVSEERVREIAREEIDRHWSRRSWMEERIERYDIRLSALERGLSALDGIIATDHEDHARLLKRLDALEAKVKDMESRDGS